MSDLTICCGQPPTLAIHQSRVYRWSGATFHQTAGPTTFLADTAASRLTVAPPTFVFGPMVNGSRSATLQLRIRNDGPQPAQDVTVMVGRATTFNVSGPKCTKDDAPICTVGTIQTGETATVDLTANTFVPSIAPREKVQMELRVGSYSYAMSTISSSTPA